MKTRRALVRPNLGQLEAISIRPIGAGGSVDDSNFVWGNSAERESLRKRFDDLLARSNAGTLSRRESEALEVFAAFLAEELEAEVSTAALVEVLSMHMDQLLAISARTDRRFEGAAKYVGRPKSDVRPKSLRPNREAKWTQSRFNYRDIAHLVGLEVVTVKARMLERFGSTGQRGAIRYFSLPEVESEFGPSPQP